MIFKEDFFEKLPNDLVKACKLICSRFFDFQESIANEDLQYPEYDPYNDYIDAYAALETFIIVNNLDSQFDIPVLEEDRTANITKIKNFYLFTSEKVDNIIAANVLEASRFKYKAQLSNIFSYTLSDGDLSRIQELINQLRDKINSSNLFSQNHKERLLRKLENMQKELHKKMSDLEKFWTFFGEAGVMLGKFGNDAKPFVDRIREILNIVWRAQSLAENLPSGMPLPMLDNPVNINSNGHPVIDTKVPQENMT